MIFFFKKFDASTLNAATRLVVVVVIIVKKQQDPSQLNHKKIAQRGTIKINFISLCYRIYLTKRSESYKFKGFLR